jgi:FemAB-related protein (PEP-CTERM system-associated)
VTFTQPLCADERQLLERIPRKTRAAIRKSLSFGLESRIATGTGKFEDLYARNLRRLGTPCFPSKHFAGIFRHFGGRADIREVVHEGKVAAAVLTFYFRDQVIPYYGASDPEFNPLQPNNFMYFDLIRWAGSRGYGVFDFGRSKMVSGSFDFKAHWGMEMRRLPYEFLLGKRKQLPHFSPNNPRFQLAIRAWRRVPLPVARLVGPPLLRQVP